MDIHKHCHLVFTRNTIRNPEIIIRYERIMAYLDFFILWDRRLIPDNGKESNIYGMKSVIVVSKDALGSDHIRVAATLPSGHPLRTLLAQESVNDFVITNGKGQAPFFFEKELKELKRLLGFAADLLFEYGNIFGIIHDVQKPLGIQNITGPCSYRSYHRQRPLNVSCTSVNRSYRKR
jgi:hypothetical protein